MKLQYTHSMVSNSPLMLVMAYVKMLMDNMMQKNLGALSAEDMTLVMNAAGYVPSAEWGSMNPESANETYNVGIHSKAEQFTVQENGVQ